MLETVAAAPPDPIIGLNEAFQADANKHKVNLSIGEYRGPDGKSPVLPSVKAAERQLLEQEDTKGYLNIVGRPDFDAAVPRLLLGNDHPALTAERVAAMQTPGGTGALRVTADFLHRVFPAARVWVSDPTWPNHANVFQAAGVAVERYPYYDADRKALKFDGLCVALQQIPAGDVVLLHGCCHNPTGVDLTVSQWQEIAEIVSHRGLLPLVDVAYQGFGDDLDADAAGIRALAKGVDELLICSSYSKNFSLYRERVGALMIVAGATTNLAAVTSRFKQCVRANYSNPPSHGAAIVARILHDDQLRADWFKELAAIRNRIKGLRHAFADCMRKYGAGSDFDFITEQRGMFSFTGLTPQHVEQLRKERAIYIVGNGRINVAGLNDDNLDYVCQSMVAVL